MLAGLQHASAGHITANLQMHRERRPFCHAQNSRSSQLCFVDPTAQQKTKQNKMSSDNSGFRAVNIPHIIRLPYHQVTAVPAGRGRRPRPAGTHSQFRSHYRKPVFKQESGFSENKTCRANQGLCHHTGRPLTLTLPPARLTCTDLFPPRAEIRARWLPTNTDFSRRAVFLSHHCFSTSLRSFPCRQRLCSFSLQRYYSDPSRNCTLNKLGGNKKTWLFHLYKSNIRILDKLTRH